MTPEELAKYRSDKLEKAQKEQADRKRAAEEHDARYRAHVEALRASVEQTVLPYLQEASKAMDGAMEVTPIRDTDGHLAGVDIILDGRTGDIKMTGATLEAYTKHPMTGEQLPYTKLRNLQDVNSDNIGGFVKFILDAGDRR
jgi:hypothetical protein